MSFEIERITRKCCLPFSRAVIIFPDMVSKSTGSLQMSLKKDDLTFAAGSWCLGYALVGTRTCSVSAAENTAC